MSVLPPESPWPPQGGPPQGGLPQGGLPQGGLPQGNPRAAGPQPWAAAPGQHGGAPPWGRPWGQPWGQPQWGGHPPGQQPWTPPGRQHPPGWRLPKPAATAEGNGVAVGRAGAGAGRLRPVRAVPAGRVGRGRPAPGMVAHRVRGRAGGRGPDPPGRRDGPAPGRAASRDQRVGIDHRPRRRRHDPRRCAGDPRLRPVLRPPARRGDQLSQSGRPFSSPGRGRGSAPGPARTPRRRRSRGRPR